MPCREGLGCQLRSSAGYRKAVAQGVRPDRACAFATLGTEVQPYEIDPLASSRQVPCPEPPDPAANLIPRERQNSLGGFFDGLDEHGRRTTASVRADLASSATGRTGILTRLRRRPLGAVRRRTHVVRLTRLSKRTIPSSATSCDSAWTPPCRQMLEHARAHRNHLDRKPEIPHGAPHRGRGIQAGRDAIGQQHAEIPSRCRRRDRPGHGSRKRITRSTRRSSTKTVDRHVDRGIELIMSHSGGHGGSIPDPVDVFSRPSPEARARGPRPTASPDRPRASPPGRLRVPPDSPSRRFRSNGRRRR